MSILNTFNIVGSALTAERFRMDTALQNIANADNTRAENDEPYRRKQVIFSERAVDFKKVLKKEDLKVNGGGVRVTDVIESDRDFVPVYDPTHPDANEDGYVMYPNVNTAEERVDLIEAANAFEANLTALSLVKSLAMKSLEIGK